jgi:multidrug resistance efflux pump
MKTEEKSNERFFLEKMISEKIDNQRARWELEQAKNELAQSRSQLSDADEYISKLESLLKEKNEKIKKLEAEAIALQFIQLLRQ